MAGSKTQVEQTTRSYDWQDFGLAQPSGANSDDGGIILSSLLSGGSRLQRGRHTMVNLDKIFPHGRPNGIGIAVLLNMTSTNSTAAFSGKAVRFRVDAYRGPKGHLDRIGNISAVVGMYKASATEGGMTRAGLGAANPIALNSARFADTMVENTSYNNGISFLDAAGNNGKASMWFDARGVANLGINLISTLNDVVEARFFITGM